MNPPLYSLQMFCLSVNRFPFLSFYLCIYSFVYKSIFSFYILLDYYLFLKKDFLTCNDYSEKKQAVDKVILNLVFNSMHVFNNVKKLKRNKICQEQNMTQQTIVGAQDVLKTSWRHALKMSWRHACLEDMSWRCPEDMSWKHLQDVLETKKNGDICISQI